MKRHGVYRLNIALLFGAFVLASPGVARADAACLDLTRSAEAVVSACTKAIGAVGGDSRTAAPLYNARAMGHRGAGRDDLALADFDAAIRANPHFAGAYANRGDLNRDAGRHERAVTDYGTAIWLKPKFARAYLGRGQSLFAIRQWNRAIADFDAFLRERPDGAAGYYHRGLVFEAKGVRALAEADFRSALKLAPDDPAIRQKARAFGQLK